MPFEIEPPVRTASPGSSTWHSQVFITALCIHLGAILTKMSQLYLHLLTQNVQNDGCKMLQVQQVRFSKSFWKVNQWHTWRIPLNSNLLLAGQIYRGKAAKMQSCLQSTHLLLHFSSHQQCRKLFINLPGFERFVTFRGGDNVSIAQSARPCLLL